MPLSLQLPLRALLTSILLALASAARAQDPNFHLFLCLGQSNMAGFPGLPEEEKAYKDPRFQVLTAVDFPDLKRSRNEWHVATPPLCEPRAGLCPADYFGRALLEKLPTGHRVGVVVVAVGGCRIELFDTRVAEDYVSKAPEWMKPMLALYEGAPYRRLVELGRLAQKQGVIQGILLHQGESNPNDPEWQGRVKFIYENLLKDLQLKAEEVPLIAGEVVAADQNGAAAGKNMDIQKLPQTIPIAHVVSAAGCPALPDRLHFTPDGYRELGRRYADTLWPLLRISQGNHTNVHTLEEGGTGPHKAIVTEDPGLPGMTIYRPRDLSPFFGEQRLPVLLWGNGACANTTQEHKNFLNEIASQGYLVLAIGRLDQIEVRDDRSRGPTQSIQLLEALGWIIHESTNEGSAYAGRVDCSKVAAMGMSCGGLQAIEISEDPRIRTTVVCNSGILPTPSPLKGMPALPKERLKSYHGPVLYIMGGPSDIAYKNAMDDYSKVDQVPIVMTNLDVGHGGTYRLPHGGEFTKVALAWLDWQLKGAEDKSRVFLGSHPELRKDGKWTVEAKNFPR